MVKNINCIVHRVLSKLDLVVSNPRIKIDIKLLHFKFFSKQNRGSLRVEVIDEDRPANQGFIQLITGSLEDVQIQTTTLYCEVQVVLT